MLAATHWNSTFRSSKVSGRWVVSSLRSGAGEYRCVRYLASVPARARTVSLNMPVSASDPLSETLSEPW